MSELIMNVEVHPLNKYRKKTWEHYFLFEYTDPITGAGFAYTRWDHKDPPYDWHSWWQFLEGLGRFTHYLQEKERHAKANPNSTRS